MVSVEVKRLVYLLPFVFPVFADGADSSPSAVDEEKEEEEGGGGEGVQKAEMKMQWRK